MFRRFDGKVSTIWTLWRGRRWQVTLTRYDKTGGWALKIVPVYRASPEAIKALQELEAQYRAASETPKRS